MTSTMRLAAASLIAAALSACATTGGNANADKVAASAAATSTSAMPTARPAPVPAGGAVRPAASGTAPAAAPGPVAAPAPGAPRAFADVIKDAKRTDGLFPLWQKDDKTWIEIPQDLLDKPFFLSINMSRGIGERFLFAGLMGSHEYSAGGEYVAEFRKAAGNIQLLARNTTFVAKAGSPEERAVRKSFSDSLLGSAPLASQPHPERKSVLIDANALLMTDIPRASNLIERMYRNAFSFDPRNSFIQSAKTDASRTVIDVTAHYAQPRIPVRVPPQPGAQPAPFYPPPLVLQDPRSLFLGFLYTFSKLPESPMSPRLADSRVGHFATAKVDFSDESKFNPVRFYVDRWRLEKKDPGAAVSEPVKPITFWLSNEIPEKHREPITAGHPRVEQGVREGRVQQRDRREAAAGRRRLRPRRDAVLVDPLVHHRDAVVRRDRSAAGRPAHRRDPGRRHRLGREHGAEHPRREVGGRDHVPADVRRGDRPCARRSDRLGRRPAVHLSRSRGARGGLRACAARGARRTGPRGARGRPAGVRLPEGHHDARGRSHARPAAQLPRIDRGHAGAVVGQGVRGEERPYRLRDGVLAGQPGAQGRETGRVLHADARRPTTTGRSSTPTSRSRPRRRRPNWRGSPAARASRNWRSRRTRTSASRSTRWSTRAT